MHFTKEKIISLENENIFLTTLTNLNNYSVSFYNYGGYIHSIHIPYQSDKSKREDVLLGYDKFDNLIKDASYLNSIVGRVSGRVSEAKFKLNNKIHRLCINNPPHHLHGGRNGFNKKIWRIKNINQDDNSISCKLFYHSPHLEENYPGNLECETTYILNENNEFIIKFDAKVDQDTLVNITNHNYWNFHGHNDRYQNIKNHKVQIMSNKYCEVNQYLIPTGNMLKTENSKYDFQKFTIINDFILDDRGIDTCYAIKGYNGILKPVATAFSEETKMGVRILSDQPGLIFYTGNMMEQLYEGKYQRKYGKQFAFCLEPQLFPDAINHLHFLSPILRKNENYTSTIVMQFDNNF